MQNAAVHALYFGGALVGDEFVGFVGGQHHPGRVGDAHRLRNGRQPAVAQALVELSVAQRHHQLVEAFDQRADLVLTLDVQQLSGLR